MSFANRFKNEISLSRKFKTRSLESAFFGWPLGFAKGASPQDYSFEKFYARINK
jgi:hypothetical protein